MLRIEERTGYVYEEFPGAFVTMVEAINPDTRRQIWVLLDGEGNDAYPMAFRSFEEACEKAAAIAQPVIRRQHFNVWGDREARRMKEEWEARRAGAKKGR